MYDLMTGELINTLSGHMNAINAVQAHPFLPVLFISIFFLKLNFWKNENENKIKEVYSCGSAGEILAWTPLLHSNLEEVLF